jgi:hypothetical protein
MCEGVRITDFHFVQKQDSEFFIEKDDNEDELDAFLGLETDSKLAVWEHGAQIDKKVWMVTSNIEPCAKIVYEGDSIRNIVFIKGILSDVMTYC